MFIYVKGLVLRSDVRPSDLTSTDDLIDLLRDVDRGGDGRYCLECPDLPGLVDTLEDGAALASMGIGDDLTEAVEGLHCVALGWLS